jgi:hypothetical protein
MNTMPAAVALLATALSASAAPLVNHSDTWRYRKGTSAPPADWKTAPDLLLDATWLSGPGWIGYGDGGTGANARGTTVSDMRMTGTNAGYRAIYVRKTFIVPIDAPLTDEVVLQTDFDDAFLAWIDGDYVDGFGVPGAPAEPPHDTTATISTHECSFGNSGSDPQPVRATLLGTVAGNLPPGPHTLAIMLVNAELDSSDAVLKVNLFTREPPPPPDLHWELSDSPVTLTGTFFVAVNQELVIDPGVEVRCHSGSDAIDCAGKLSAVGTAAQRIRFVRATAGSGWNRIRMAGTPECIFRYCDFDGSSTSGTVRGSGSSGLNPSVVLDHCRWLNTDVQMVDFTWTSCVITDCEFDSIGAQELIHFSNMPPAGRALIRGCRFGLPGTPPSAGYNDIVDFTGGNRPGPIAQFLGNVFLGSVDDCFDMDGTDAHIEGNIFLNVSKDASRSTSSNPITTGASGANRSELVICRNVFYNGEHMFMEKDYGTAILQNNTVVKLFANPFSDNTDSGGNEAGGLIMFGEPWRGFPYGDGAIFEGNIATEIDNAINDPWPVLTYASAEPGFFFPRRYNCIRRFPQPGAGNIDADPLLVSTSGINHTNILEKFALQSGSPCRGTGPNGLDMGALVPAGASIRGQVAGTTASRDASLTIAGPGIWSYQWRLDGGAWSNEVSLVPQSAWDGAPFTGDMFDHAPPLVLTNLSDGPHTVEVRGKNSAGAWQDASYAAAAWTVEGPADADADGDGMSDAWESTHGLDPQDASDADTDADGDTAPNRDEFIAGTDPQSRNSALKASAARLPNGRVQITFDAVAGKSYRIEASATLAGGSWLTIATLPPQSSSGPVSVEDPSAGGEMRKFYRLATP